MNWETDASLVAIAVSLVVFGYISLVVSRDIGSGLLKAPKWVENTLARVVLVVWASAVILGLIAIGLASQKLAVMWP